MANGATELQAQIARLRKLAKLVPISAPAVAAAVRTEIVRQLAAGEGPDGTSWKATKEGGQPLQGAAAALSVSVEGTVILIRVDGYHARHHLGAVKGKVKRQIIPTGKIPDPVSRAIDRVLSGEFDRIMGSR